MNKKGFTLVELLAVVAILAILVIVALPNVMGMFNSAKKTSFQTEVKNIYKQAEQQWVMDSMFETSDKEYGRCSGCSYKQLDLSGRSELNYYVKVNKEGKIVSYVVDDGTYNYNYSGTGLYITEITEDKINISNGELEINNDVIVYTINENNLFIGNTIPSNVTKYNTPQEALSNSDGIVFLKVVLSSDVISEVYVGFKLNGNIHYLRGGDNGAYHESNKTVLNGIFSADRCFNDYNCNNCDDVNYDLEYFNAGSSRYGDVSANKGCYGCHINQNNSFSCGPMCD